MSQFFAITYCTCGKINTLCMAVFVLQTLHTKNLTIVCFPENIFPVGHSDGIWTSARVCSRHFKAYDLSVACLQKKGVYLFVTKRFAYPGRTSCLDLGQGKFPTFDAIMINFKTAKVLS